jgi:hypothetical protein
MFAKHCVDVGKKEKRKHESFVDGFRRVLYVMVGGRSFLGESIGKKSKR